MARSAAAIIIAGARIEINRDDEQGPGNRPEVFQ